MTVRADAFFQIFFEPLHSLLVLDLGKGILHRINRAVIIKIVVLLQFTVINNFFLLWRQITKWNICPHAHRPHDILH